MKPNEVEYLQVRNWEKFQYRTDKKLPWIRTYDAQLEDYNYTRLSDAERGLLHDVRLLANRLGNRIPNDPGWIARVTKSKSKSNAYRTVPLLVSLGFLEPYTPGDETPANVEVVSAQSAHNGRSECAGDRDRDRDNPLPLSRQGRKTVVAAERWLSINGSQLFELGEQRLVEVLRDEFRDLAELDARRLVSQLREAAA